MSDEMKKAVEAMQEAVDKEMERKAKLGYKAVIADKHGRPKAVPPSTSSGNAGRNSRQLQKHLHPDISIFPFLGSSR